MSLKSTISKIKKTVSNKKIVYETTNTGPELEYETDYIKKPDEISELVENTKSLIKVNMELLACIPKLHDEIRIQKKRVKKLSIKHLRRISVDDSEEEEPIKDEIVNDKVEEEIYNYKFGEDDENDDDEGVDEEDSSDEDNVDKDNLIEEFHNDKLVYYDPDKNLVYDTKYKIIGYVNDEGEIMTN